MTALRSLLTVAQGKFLMYGFMFLWLLLEMEQRRPAANLLGHMTAINHNFCEVLCYSAAQAVLGKEGI